MCYLHVMVRFFMVLSLAIFTYLGVQAQDREKRTDYLSSSIWTGVGVNYILSDSSYFFFQNQYRFNQDFLGVNGELGGLFRIHNWVGYQFHPTKYWYLGVSEKFVHRFKSTTYFTKINMEHRWFADNVSFEKELAFEWLANPNSLDFGRVSFQLKVPAKFTINEHLLRVIPSYRFFFNFDMDGDDENPIYDQRKVDMGRLRLDIEYEVVHHLYVSLFAMTETWYQVSLATFDAKGNQIKPDEDLNRVIPTFGLNVVYNIYK